MLAQQVDAEWTLMDERRGRQALEKLGLVKIGTLGILLKAKEVGLLEHIRPALETLNEREFRLSAALVQRILKAAGEE